MHTFSPEQMRAIAERLRVVRRRVTRDASHEDAEIIGAIVDLIAMDLATELPPGLPRDSIQQWMALTGSSLTN